MPDAELAEEMFDSTLIGLGTNAIKNLADEYEEQDLWLFEDRDQQQNDYFSRQAKLIGSLDRLESDRALSKQIDFAEISRASKQHPFSN